MEKFEGVTVSPGYAEGKIMYFCARQVDFSRTLANYKGSVFYGYGAIKENENNVAVDVKTLFERGGIVQNKKEVFDEIVINYPDNNSYVNSKNTYVLGYCNPDKPLYLDNVPVSKTVDGYFSVYLPLEKGKNSFEFSQGDNKEIFTVNYATVNKSAGTSSTYKTMDKFEILNPVPEKETWVAKGTSLKLSCAAPSGSIVTATIGGMKVTLSPTINPPAKSTDNTDEFIASENPTAEIFGDKTKVLSKFFRL